MINKRIPLLLTILASVTTVTALVIEVSGIEIFKGIKTNISILAVLLTLTAAISVYLVVKTITDNPSSLTVSLIGYPNSGKTVYITVLFAELEKNQQGKFEFRSYGSETIERVLENMLELRRRQWLSKTKMGDVFYFRSYVNLPTPIFTLRPSRYKLEIADFAGENTIDDANSSNVNWLHKNDYFSYVINSNIVFLAIDTEKIIDDNYLEMISGFNGAVKLMIKHKEDVFSKKVSNPLCILLMKSDLLDKSMITKNEVEKIISELKTNCESRFKFVKTFFVSSMGEINDDGTPPSEIRPVNVIEPLKWAIERVG